VGSVLLHRLQSNSAILIHTFIQHTTTYKIRRAMHNYDDGVYKYANKIDRGDRPGYESGKSGKTIANWDKQFNNIR